MYHTSTNITPKYRQKTHYNCIKIAAFGYRPLPGKKGIQRQGFPTSVHGITIRI